MWLWVCECVYHAQTVSVTWLLFMKLATLEELVMMTIVSVTSAPANKPTYLGCMVANSCVGLTM